MTPMEVMMAVAELKKSLRKEDPRDSEDLLLKTKQIRNFP